MENLMKFYRWMEMFQPSISIRNGVLCCGDPKHDTPR